MAQSNYAKGFKAVSFLLYFSGIARQSVFLIPNRFSEKQFEKHLNDWCKRTKKDPYFEGLIFRYEGDAFYYIDQSLYPEQGLMFHSLI